MRPYKHKHDTWILHHYNDMCDHAPAFRIDAVIPMDDRTREDFWLEIGNLHKEVFLRGLKTDKTFR